MHGRRSAILSACIKSERPHSFRRHGRPSVNYLKSELSPPFFSPSPLLVRHHRWASAGLSLDSQAGRPIPPGSFTQALRIDRVADRPSALHPEALRRGGWNNATGSTCSGRCDHQDHRSQEGASLPMTSPDIPPELLLPESTSVGSCLGSSALPKYSSPRMAQVPVFLRVTPLSSAVFVDVQVTLSQARMTHSTHQVEM